MIAVELTILFILILFNGFMAMSELAVVSARPARLKARRDKGERGASRAIALSSDPGRFLSTVQIGITLVGVLSGAFSGATLGVRLSDTLATLGVPPSIANPAGIGIVVALITYVSLIIGELVPKQIALKNADGIAVRVAPIMVWIARIAMPLVWLLDISGRTVLTLLGQNSQPSRHVTDEEIRTLIAEAEHAGTIESGERRMITGVMRLADRKARAIMTPRGEVDWIDLTVDEETIVDMLRRTDHSLLPAGKGSMNALTGVIRIRDISIADIEGKGLDIADRVHPAPLVHDNTPALDVLTLLREAEVPMVLVHDEFGTFEGVVTPADILEAIAGVFRADAEEGELDIIQREDGSWLLPGMMPADEMADHLSIRLPPERSYSTLAGFLLTHFQELPKIGNKVDIENWRFEVVDMDGRRIDQVIASRGGQTEAR
ncbi:hemolysin family protein [Nitratireductor luteus]|uniref:hemolysin family protein n=1 Tax=Nitratireductor luteus TaxID=2976980 RepID=UPI00223ECAB4|nr:hemolysin family protein [Nitratireductor luteus]